MTNDAAPNSNMIAVGLSRDFTQNKESSMEAIGTPNYTVTSMREAMFSNTTTVERSWLEQVFDRYDASFPNLDQIWQLMDEVWEGFDCDPECMDERIGAFYSHPVWLLNGLFIEQHDLSLDNRRAFTDWVAQQAPARIADYGGGFGSLARMVGLACPETSVEVIEPHPHPAAIARAEETANVRYRPALSGEYDILIATDVFEHVPDPLGLVEETARHLRPDGRYLIANCFWPVIACHLPQTFHFRYSWDDALTALGLMPEEMVCYGRSFRRQGPLSLERARGVEQRSRRWFPWLERLPARVRHRASRLILDETRVKPPY